MDFTGVWDVIHMITADIGLSIYSYDLTNDCNVYFSCVTENINDVENIMFRHIARIVVSSQNLNSGNFKQRNTDTRFTYLIHFAIYSRFYLSLYLYMMTSSNGNIFRVTGHLCGEFTGPGEFPTQRPVTRSFDVFFDLRLNKRLSKQSWGWWFETLSRPLWRQCNEMWSLRTVLNVCATWTNMLLK